MRSWIGRTGLLASTAYLLIQGTAYSQERQAYFGETHVHTGWSFDAYIFGNTKTTPVDAYAAIVAALHVLRKFVAIPRNAIASWRRCGASSGWIPFFFEAAQSG